MAENQDVNQVQASQENKPSDKEFNFRAIEAKLREERSARMEAEKKAEDALRLVQESQKYRNNEEEEYDNEPYVDHKKLDKKLYSFEKRLEEKIEKKAEEKALYLMQKKEEEEWISKNSDFDEVLTEENLTKFVAKAPALADSIKRMPNGVEKQKLVYNAIKTMGIDKPEKQSSVQDKIDSNRRSPYYQPSGVANAPYAMAGDFTPSGQKNAYNKLQELKKRFSS